MAARRIRITPTGNGLEDQRRRDAAADTEKSLRAPFLDGRRIDGVQLTAGEVVVTHKLGRRPVGWWVIDQLTAPASLYRTSWDSQRITFTSGGTGSCSLWVF